MKDSDSQLVTYPVPGLEGVPVRRGTVAEHFALRALELTVKVAELELRARWARRLVWAALVLPQAAWAGWVWFGGK